MKLKEICKEEFETSGAKKAWDRVFLRGRHPKTNAEIGRFCGIRTVNSNPMKIRSVVDRQNRARRLGVKTKPWAAAYLGVVDGEITNAFDGIPEEGEEMEDLFGDYKSEDENPFEEDSGMAGADEPMDQMPEAVAVTGAAAAATISEEIREEIERKRKFAQTIKEGKRAAAALVTESIQKKRRLALKRRAKRDFGKLTGAQIEELRQDPVTVSIQKKRKVALKKRAELDASRLTEAQVEELRRDELAEAAAADAATELTSDPTASSSHMPMTLVLEGPAEPPAMGKGSQAERKQEGGNLEEPKPKRSRWNSTEDMSRIVANAIAKERGLALSLCRTAVKKIEPNTRFDDEPNGECPWDESDEEQDEELLEESSCEFEGVEHTPVAAPMVIDEPAQPMFTSELSTEALEDLVEMQGMGLTVAWPRGMDATVANVVIRNRKAGIN